MPSSFAAAPMPICSARARAAALYSGERTVRVPFAFTTCFFVFVMVHLC